MTSYLLFHVITLTLWTNFRNIAMNNVLSPATVKRRDKIFNEKGRKEETNLKHNINTCSLSEITVQYLPFLLSNVVHLLLHPQ